MVAEAETHLHYGEHAEATHCVHCYCLNHHMGKAWLDQSGRGSVGPAKDDAQSSADKTIHSWSDQFQHSLIPCSQPNRMWSAASVAGRVLEIVDPVVVVAVVMVA